MSLRPAASIVRWYRISWTYEDNRYPPEIHDRAWFNEDNGFTEEYQAQIDALAPGDQARFPHEMFGVVEAIVTCL
jgi:hypothetical protein